MCLFCETKDCLLLFGLLIAIKGHAPVRWNVTHFNNKILLAIYVKFHAVILFYESLPVFSNMKNMTFL